MQSHPSFIPKLAINFRPTDDTTRAVVEALWAEVDTRKSAAKLTKQAHAVICGILALKAYPEFKVDRRTLTKPEAAAFDLVAERHMGSLVQRTSGHNRYCVSPKFKDPTTVTEASQRTLSYRVVGAGVNYTTPSGIPSAEAVKLIHGTNALPCYVKDVGTAFELMLQGESLPNRYESLPEITLSQRALQLLSEYTNFLDKMMPKRGLLAVRVPDDSDPNTMQIAATHAAAKDLGQWVMNVAYTWTKSVGLKHIVPPVHIWSPKEQRWDINVGIPYQQRLETGDA